MRIFTKICMLSAHKWLTVITVLLLFDSLHRPEFVTVMLASSNQTNRNIYEAKTPSRGTRRPIHSASRYVCICLLSCLEFLEQYDLSFVTLYTYIPQLYREEREAWIRAKYEKKEFLADLPSSEMSVAEVSINLYRRCIYISILHIKYYNSEMSDVCNLECCNLSCVIMHQVLLLAFTPYIDCHSNAT